MIFLLPWDFVRGGRREDATSTSDHDKRRSAPSHADEGTLLGLYRLPWASTHHGPLQRFKSPNKGAILLSSLTLAAVQKGQRGRQNFESIGIHIASAAASRRRLDHLD